MTPTLISSPLQGFTDHHFRNVFHNHFTGIDEYYAPYIRLTNSETIKNSNKNDLLPENNTSVNISPQIMTNSADEFLFVIKFVQELGYKHINWNLGCPYPMVTKRKLGSGLVQHPESIDEILNKVFAESDINISIKMRLGLEDSQEVLQVLPVLEKYKLKNIAIHPRLGKQLYKGKPDLEAFKICLENTSHTVHYNGDIATVSDFQMLKDKFPTITHWMLGRGILADPFLPSMIKENTIVYPENKNEIFRDFYNNLYHEFEQSLNGPSHLHNKILHYWEYFALFFPESKKEIKKIKKAQNIKGYEKAVETLLNKA